MLSDNKFDAVFAELAGIRRALTSIAASLAETSSYQHEDLQDIVASIDGLAVTAAISSDVDSLDD